MRKSLVSVFGLAMILACAVPANATQINFTGGTVVRVSGPNQTTNNLVTWDNVDYYLEGGFKLDFIGNTTNFSSHIGNYYNAGNDVIHGHWATGDFGSLSMIKVTKEDGSAFDLNYFVLTSNTATGGGLASGSERVRLVASTDGINESFSTLLSPENWGFPAAQVNLGSEFDQIRAFWFIAENDVDCFGMDNFFIDEAAPNELAAVPEPATLALLGLGLAGVAVMRRRK